MKIFSFSLIVVSFAEAAAAAAESVNAAFTPYRLSFETLSSTVGDDLVDGAFLEALTTTGMVSVTELPVAAKQAARKMTATQHACLIESGNTQEQRMPDGTVRITMATHTVAGVGGMQALKHETDNSEACAAFEEATKVFRKTTHAAVMAFAHKLTLLLNVSEGPLLMTAQEEAFPFTTFSDVVKYGEHLEHFHSYQKLSESEEQATIDVHTDQGLFLAFTPGRLATGELTTGFSIQLFDGSMEQVVFAAEDELIFLLGDGVNQYVNKKVMGDTKLRAVPHALQLESSEQARVWYGLMVLPPVAAIHPVHGITFGEIRQGLVGGQEQAVRLACSNAVSNHRFLHSENTGDTGITTCDNADEIYCWYQCMNVTTYNVSNALCNETSRVLKCINPRDQLWSSVEHGDYFPGCAAYDAVNETAFPTLPNYPRNDTVCTDFAAFYSDGVYTNNVTLDGDEGSNGALFQYTVVNGKVQGRLAFNGIFGYLALGLAGQGGINAMQNAHIVMAMRGGDYTADTGMNLSTGPVVSEYVIDPIATAFRFWDTPYVASSRMLDQAIYNVTTDGNCYTSLSFEANAFAGQAFNLQGTDKMIWAANNVDTFMQYHGPNHAVFEINWVGTTAAEASTNVGASSGAASSSSIMTMTALVVTLLASVFF